MAASYPGTKRVFTTRVDTLDVVFASHMNDTQDEIRAIQDTLGVNPHVSTAGGGSSFGAWSGATRTYQTLADRLANIEAGLIADTHSQYARLANTETFTGTKTFSATDTFFGAATGTTSGNVLLSSGTTGGQASLAWREGTTNRWRLAFTQGTTTLTLRDSTNARDHATFTPGASSTAAVTTLYSSLSTQGNATVAGTLGVTGATTMAALTLSGALTLAAGTGALPSTSAVGQAAAGGTSTTVARADHVHGREAFGTTTAASTVGGAAAAGAATTVSRSDHVHALGAGAVVAETGWGLAATNGVATSAARSDHSHGSPPAPTPASVGALATVGGTLTGGLTITGTGAPGGQAGTSLRIATATPQIEFYDTDMAAGATGRRWWFHLNGGTFYLLRDADDNNTWDVPHPITVSAAGRVTAGVELYEGSARVYSPNNLPPSANPVVIMPFFIGGAVAVGLRRPQFIATQNMTIRGARSIAHVGSGSYEVYVNGANVSGAAGAFGIAQALYDFADVNIVAGDRVQLNVATATADAADLSVTIDVVTR